jgi:hypothetical protein
LDARLVALIPAKDSGSTSSQVVDANRDDGQRFVVRADEKLTVFLELESTIPRLRRIGLTGWQDFCQTQRR